jgi:two-component sensor histidine kinase
MAGRVKWSLSGDKILLGIDQAIPCSLIINELVMNSLKHAFPGGKEGKIMVAFSEDDSRMVEVVVSDDGIGMGEEVNWEAPTSVGLDLVKGLVGQIDGAIELDRSRGTRFKIRFRRI